MKSKLYLLLLLLIGPAFSWAAPAFAETDVVLNAVTDEMKRTVGELHSESHPKPYFVSYTVRDVELALLGSCLGSPAEMNRSRFRVLDPIVRIGDYKLDSSYSLTTYPHYLHSLTADDDYDAIRNSVWLETDKEYKAAVANFEWKKAYLSSNTVPDRLAEMTKEPALVSLGATAKLPDDQQKWAQTIEKLSAIFKKYPKLQESKVEMAQRCVNRWLVNSEGTQVRDSELRYVLLAWASAQASDGMEVSDYEVFGSYDPQKIPSFEELKPAVEAVALRVTDLSSAPLGDDYCGPVLFKGQAAAELFSQIMAPNLGLAEDYVGTESWRHPLKRSIGRRILPKFITVTDDPTLREFDGKPLFGGYKIDEEGVAAQKVTLVENGILKAFCQSRLPTKYATASNGHALGGHGIYSILKISSSKTSTPKELNEQMMELAKDAGLDYVIVIDKLADEFHLSRYPPAETDLSHINYAYPAYSEHSSEPTMAYRVYLKDGRRELVRGLEFKSVTLRAFKDIQAVGDDQQAYLIEPADYMIRHLITPSYLIGELELSAVRSEHVAPPKLPSPVQLEAQSRSTSQ